MWHVQETLTISPPPKSDDVLPTTLLQPITSDTMISCERAGTVIPLRYLRGNAITIISPLIRARQPSKRNANYATPTSRSFPSESVVALASRISRTTPPRRQKSAEECAQRVGREGGTKKCRRFSATTERRPILISELLPFYFNFLAFKPSKRVYLRNIIAEDRRESPAGRVGQREKVVGFRGRREGEREIKKERVDKKKNVGGGGRKRWKYLL